MQSFLEMCELVDDFQLVLEAGPALAKLTDRIAADAPPELRPFIDQIINKGWRGGTHSLQQLEKANGANVNKLHDAILYLQEKGVVRFNDDDSFQVSDINQTLAGGGGSALKGARAGAISRKMVQAGRDAPRPESKYGTWTDLDEAKKKFPQYAAIFEKIASSGAWQRLQRGGTPKAGALFGIKATGGDFSPNVEQFLQALMALKHMGVLFFEGKKPTLDTIVMKSAPEIEDPAKAYQGPSTASDKARASADADAKLWHANKGHGGTAQEKMAPGRMASAAGMHNDDPTQAISREWWQAWQTAMQAVDRDPTLWENEKWLDQLETHTMKTLQNIAGQIKKAIDGGQPRDAVKPMLTNFFMIAEPRNSEHKPVSMFAGVHDLMNKLKALYNGAYKRQATVPGHMG